jgi:hypothetical protein
MRPVSAVSTHDLTGTQFPQHSRVRHRTGSAEDARSAKRTHEQALKLSAPPISPRIAQLVAQLAQYRQANSDGRFNSLISRLESKIAALMTSQTQFQNTSGTLDVVV